MILWKFGQSVKQPLLFLKEVRIGELAAESTVLVSPRKIKRRNKVVQK